MVLFSIIFYFSILFLSVSMMFCSAYKIFSKKVALVFIFFILVLVSTFRGEKVGADFGNYIKLFIHFQNCEWNNLFKKQPYVNQDYGYYILTKIITEYTNNNIIFVAFIASLTIFLYLRNIYKESRITWLSLLAFIALTYLGTFNLVRQYLAMAILYFSFDYLKDKKALYFFITVFIASSIQISALSFILMYPFMLVKNNKKLFPFVLLVCLTLYLFGSSVMQFGLGIYNRGYSFNDGSGEGLKLFFLLLTICCTSIFFVDTNKKEFKPQIAALYIALINQSLSYHLTMFGRLNFIYSYIVFVLLIPNLISEIRNKMYRLTFITIYMMFCLLIYLLSLNINNPSRFFPYYFCF